MKCGFLIKNFIDCELRSQATTNERGIAIEKCLKIFPKQEFVIIIAFVEYRLAFSCFKLIFYLRTFVFLSISNEF